MVQKTKIKISLRILGLVVFFLPRTLGLVVMIAAFAFGVLRSRGEEGGLMPNPGVQGLGCCNQQRLLLSRRECC
jgi:hypothetical protein